MAKRGRPLIYKNKKDLEAAIEDYFASCEGTPLFDKDNVPVLDKYNNQIYLNRKPPTITGLAYALGLGGRQALLNYQGRKEFKDTITRAKLRVEEYAERRLYDRNGTQGAQFTLRANFGWRDNAETEDKEALDKLDAILNGIVDNAKPKAE